MKRIAFMAACTALILTGCGMPGAKGVGDAANKDPYRDGFMTACTAYPQYARTGEAKAARYCKCVYSKTTADLNADETQLAAFYLYGQLGAKPEELDLFKTMNLNAMGKASTAIGKAVSACRGP